ncbi:MAG TPA: DUF4180 domain-containing protein [Devosiaceae bacterium]
MDIVTLGASRTALLDADGPVFAREDDALEVIGALYGQDVELVVIPVSRLAPEFFMLGTRLAGLFLQKLRNYQLRVAILGDISAQLAQSAALRNFVYESNKGRQVVFAADRDELARLV